MSKGIDLVALLEWADRQKAFKQPKPKGFGRKTKVKEFNLVDLLRQKKEEADLLEKYLKDQEKINKKEEKKPEDPKRSFSFLEWYIIGALSYPLLGPLYHMVVK